MDSQKINSILKYPEEVKFGHTVVLNEVIEKYPYFQAARAVQLKALNDQNSLQYNDKLKETAAYTVDRGVLFDFITSKVFEETFESNNLNSEENSAIDSVNTNSETLNQIEQQNFEATISNAENNSGIAVQNDEEIVSTRIISEEENTLQLTSAEAEQITDPELFEAKKTENITSAEALINKPLAFNKNEMHSFSEWLKLASLKPIEREEIALPIKEKKLIESELIDKFIKNTPKISPVSKNTPTTNLAKRSNTSSESLMTETLADVYLAQKNYKKAIQAYKILSLKNPEKSGLFADRIRAIEKLMNDN